MLYIAVTFIGSKYVPGEIITEDIPKEKLEWLKRAGAIREYAQDPIEPKSEPKASVMNEEFQPLAFSREEHAETETDDGIGDAEDEFDDEAEVPEIDVMDGLVHAQDEPKREKPTRMAHKKGAKGGKTR